MSNVSKILLGAYNEEDLAQAYLEGYFSKEAAVFPINPFQMLKDSEVPFIFRDLKKHEGIYIQADNQDNYPLVGINANRPITRQRYTAAHELCHHIKDAQNNICCLTGSTSNIERFAEQFAAALLMPLEELKSQVKKYLKNGYVDFDDVLMISHYFGVSFASCLYRIAYKLHKIEGDTSSTELRKRISKFEPDIRSKELGLNNILLYEQLFNTSVINMNFKPNNFAKQKFQSEYVFNDSRMEGVDIEIEKVAEIVTDLRLKKQESEYCSAEHENIIQVAGLSIMYNKIFEMVDQDVTAFSAIELNRCLYSCAPYPEYGGKFRETNTLVIGAKFETIDYKEIFNEISKLNDEVVKIIKDIDKMSISEYIEKVVRIHHRFTVIHPFPDGNGRTSRAFLNLLFIKNNIPPIFFNFKKKAAYRKALNNADVNGDYSEIYELVFKQIIESSAKLIQFIQ